MSTPLKNIFALPKGMLLFLGLYAVSFPLIWLEFHFTGHSVVGDAVGLSSALVWKGQFWRLASYAFFTAGVLGWAINLFWFATLIGLLRNDWSSLNFWMFCIVAAVGGALPIILFSPHDERIFLGAGALIFALLVAWDRLYKRERIMMLGIGEVSVRQAALFVAGLNAVICFFSCGGWLFTLSMVCGGVAGWLYLAIGDKRVMSRGGKIIGSERVARLEL